MGNPAIILSLSDPAGQTIFNVLKNKGFKNTKVPWIFQYRNISLIIVEPLIVPEVRYMNPQEPKPYPADIDRIAKENNIDYFVVASRHWAKSGQPSLTVHPTGNFGKAMYGGNNRELQLTSPQSMRNIYVELSKDPPKGYNVSLEVTHHSPTQFRTPLFFAEIGSREAQWRNVEVCTYLVESILKGIISNSNTEVAIGFGGGHYCPKFSLKMNENAMGHMAAKYSLELITDDLLQQMIVKSPGAKIAFSDGLKGRHKKKIEKLLKKHEIPLIN